MVAGPIFSLAAALATLGLLAWVALEVVPAGSVVARRIICAIVALLGVLIVVKAFLDRA